MRCRLLCVDDDVRFVFVMKYVCRLCVKWCSLLMIFLFVWVSVL